MRVEAASDSSLFISFGDSISLEAHRRVISLFHGLEGLRDPRIYNLHPAYSSLLIDFDPLLLTHEELENLVAPLIVEASNPESSSHEAAIFKSSSLEAGPCNPEGGGFIEIPVCYDAEFAPDLASVAQHATLSEEQVIATHAGGDYFVYFLGFAPGFAYLGGLDRSLHVPRLATPRKQVNAGAVGIGGAQTGVYPNDSPGGWQLIGRTPLRMFDASSDPPSRLQPGERLRFRRIDRGEFDRLARQPERER
jgi:KipI family sensor histidine kinase inhibitor